MQIRNRQWKCLFVLIFVSLIPLVVHADDRPNILFLFSDDQRADTIAAYGNSEIETPVLDQLVQKGMSFKRTYCMGSIHGAVCQPSRAMLMSGRSLYRVPMDLKNTPIFPELLRSEGYETFGTGKWHNNPPAFIRGFTKGKAVFMGGMSNHLKVPLRDLDSETGKLINQRIGNGFSSELFADATIDFLKTHHKKNSAQPFLAYVSFSSPHDPRMPPEKFLNKYWPDQVSLPENFLPQHPFNTGWMIGRDEALAAWPREEKIIKQQLAEYYGMISHLDSQISRILKTLKETGLDENTIIIFSSDHGLAMGSHGLLGKQNLYEVSMRAPLIISGKGIPASKSSESLTYLYDIMPTICDLTGTTIPAGVEGKSLLPIIKGQQESIRDSLFLTYEKSQRAVTDGRWKLIRYPDINKTQLFDLKSDPDEMIDLASKPDFLGQKERLFSLLKNWQKKAADQVSLTSKNPKPETIDLTGHPRKPDRHQPPEILEKYFK
jgi:arylsulfatase A-like enzyme